MATALSSNLHKVKKYSRVEQTQYLAEKFIHIAS